MARTGLSVLVSGGVGLVVAGAVPARVKAQQGAATSLVFDGATVVDVEQGKLLPAQRVVIAGNRIQAVGSANQVRVPQGAQVVAARGKYLIPGFWDLHVHTPPAIDPFYALLLANGVTGIRDAGSLVPHDTLIRRRREIQTGTRVGPPRQILSSQALDGSQQGCTKAWEHHTCVADSAHARHVVDSFATAGADMIKTYDLSREMYFVVAAEARRRGIPFGGHVETVTAAEASDSGAIILDHTNTSGGLSKLCMGPARSVEQCQPLVEKFRRNGTWLVPTLVRLAVAGATDLQSGHIFVQTRDYAEKFWTGSAAGGNWLSGSVAAELASHSDRPSGLSLVQQLGLPMLAGSDADGSTLRLMPAGFALHAELAMDVGEGLTPLTALQSATLNPAKFLHATDSLGTVAPGKLADLVLLDADPLADITNTTTIRAVVANGRYFDRTALDNLLAKVRAKAEQEP